MADDGSEKSTPKDQGSEMGLGQPQAALRPLSPGVDTQWKAVFYESVQPRALHLQDRRVAKFHRDKRLETKVEKKEPPDDLARDWFDDERTTLGTRAYLLDKLLPTLVPGVEKLLRVAERKKALDAAALEPPKFDPINFLGEYLMRHNPAYAISAQPNPYMRGMKAVTEELKSKVPQTTPNKVAEMKTLVEERRHQREEMDKIKGKLRSIRKKALSMQFREWTRDTAGRIPLALVQSALKSFLEVVTGVPRDSEAGIYARPLEAVGTLEVKVNREECTEYLLSYVKNFNSDLFEQLLKHLLQCANDTRNAIRHDVWRWMFVQLFFDCDPGQVGLLDRPRVFSLLEFYYDNALQLAKKGYRDPRKCVLSISSQKSQSNGPMVELDDIDLTEFWGNIEDDVPFDESRPPTPAMGLSEEAMVLNEILKGILSDMDLDVPKTPETSEGTSPEAPRPEGTSLEPPGPEATADSVASAVEEGSEAVPMIDVGEQTDVPSEARVQEERAPDGEPTAEESARPVDEEGGPEATPAEPPGPTVEGEEADGGEQPEKPIPPSLPEPGEPELSVPTPSLSQTAANLQQFLDQELSPEPEAGSEEKALDAQEEAGEAEKDAPQEGEHGEEREAGEAETQSLTSEEEQPAADLRKPSAEKAPGPQLLSAPQPAKARKRAPQLIYGERWSGDFRTNDLSFKYTDYGKEIREDWNNENSRFPDLRMNMIEIQARGPPSSTSAFEKDSLNLPQFVQLMETFVGEETSLLNLKKLVEFVRDGYVQTENEKIKQLEKIHNSSFLAWQQLLLAGLFEKWDNESSGFLDMKEVDAVLATFKEGMEEEALSKAKLQLPIPQWHPSGIVKLTQKDFQVYVELVVSELAGHEDEVLENIVEFLMMAVEWSHLERLRGNARRKWLLGIQHVARTSGGSLEPVYQALFKSLARDADAHGDSKKISAYIALLEYNLINPSRGDILLHYVACTEEDAPYVLNQNLFMDMKGISFAAALQDRPIHVPRVQLHGNIQFWNYDRLPKERAGSFLVLPLEDIRRRVFGVLGLDTLRDKSDQTIFVPHEIRFYQGIANTFSIAYHHVRTQDSLMQAIITGVGWLSTRTSSLRTITAYFMEPGEDRMHDYTLRKMMTSDLKEKSEVHPPPAPVLSRKENFFSNYLFRCIDCSMVVTAVMREEHHVAVPLRNPMGHAIMAFDLNLGHREQLPSCEHKDLQKMLKMVQAAACEILKEDSGELDPYYVLEAEYVGDWRRGGVLFYRFMLQDLQNCIWNLDPWVSFGEIRCFEEPPPLVHTILKCVLLVLYPQWAGTDGVENWSCCIQKLDGELIENICYFDPTAAYVEIRPEVLYSCLQGARRQDVWRFGSAPLEHLYNWTHTCLSLIELAKKLQHRQATAHSSSVLLTPNLSRSLRSSQISTNRTSSLA